MELDVKRQTHSSDLFLSFFFHHHLTPHPQHRSCFDLLAPKSLLARCFLIKDGGSTIVYSGVIKIFDCHELRNLVQNDQALLKTDNR
ncbi:unnamed protein product [Lactuca virosa]|uniref:Uncharacterized protein n=1 Tax=Lactuca virosa TaxID=75947 RepID=A0AAU9PA27_9ASTR|nr:unnamed protein product [Lactuca virosa]